MIPFDSHIGKIVKTMKKALIYRILPFFVAAALLVTGCTKNQNDVRLDPSLSTSQIYHVTSDSATIVGFIISSGNGFTEKGICYSTSATPTTANSKAVFTGESAKASFTMKIGNLDYATKYYARAYGINESGTFYGEEMTFTTLPVIPTVTTAAATNITGNSATTGGEVTVSGGADVTARGVCYGTSHNPTLSDSKTSNDTGMGVFTSSLTGLLGNTVYYVRAYAINSAGTAYGTEITFTTLVDFPKVSTTAVTGITKTTAESGGNVTYDGGGTVTERGLVWSLSADPTTADNVITDASTGTGSYVSSLTGLSLYTTYHVRAYAINGAGTAYGNDIAFTTLADITKFFVVGTNNSWDNSDAAPYIISSPDDPASEGYVYFSAAGEFKLTTDHSWTDPYTFGDGGSGTLANPGGNIVIPAAGYYKIIANIQTMTYSIAKTDWGVIGDATPNGWTDETALTFNPAANVWQGVMHLTSGQFKFRANHTWDYNYGSTTADANLDAGGSNINVTVESDYIFELNLSTPRQYTYTAYRWGVIGDATPGGWTDDTNMTWDPANHVFTVTLNLTAGSFKFRANDDWGVNYGGTLAALTAGGDNMPITTPGNYTITFDPYNLVGTLTAN